MTRAERECLFTELFASNQARMQRLCYGAMHRLREQSEPFLRSYWLIFTAVALCENVCVVSLSYQWTWPVRGACHLLATALLELGRYVRIRRFERECRPILDRLTAIEQSLREEAE
jgi:hypothetical protein